jgi:hypothetical protein
MNLKTLKTSALPLPCSPRALLPHSLMAETVCTSIPALRERRP